MAMPVDRDYDFDPAIKKIMNKLEEIDKSVQELKNKNIPAPKTPDKKKVN
ncbi:MAG: hypothetical protein WDA47_05005 [Bacilli bacterium]